MIKLMLASFKPVIKSKLMSLLFQYGSMIKSKEDLQQVKEYLTGIVDEIIEDYSKENNL